MAYHVSFTPDKTVPGWPAGSIRYYPYPSGTCQQAVAAFAALTDAQKLAATVATIPSPAAGTHWVARNCSGTVTPTVNILPEGPSDNTISGTDYLGTPFTTLTAPTGLTA